MRTFFTSDLHFGHDKLRTLFNPKRAAKWDTLDKMNQGIIKNINDRVGENDELWALGDLTFANMEKTHRLIEQIHCRTVNCLIGNHDSESRLLSLFDSINTKVGYEKFFLSSDRIVDLQIEKQNIVLCHYPLHFWERSHYGSWHLHGHEHGNIRPFGKRADVGFDSSDVLGDCLSVVSFEEVKAYMDARPVQKHP